MWEGGPTRSFPFPALAAGPLCDGVASVVAGLALGVIAHWHCSMSISRLYPLSPHPHPPLPLSWVPVRHRASKVKLSSNAFSTIPAGVSLLTTIRYLGKVVLVSNPATSPPLCLRALAPLLDANTWTLCGTACYRPCSQLTIFVASCLVCARSPPPPHSPLPPPASAPCSGIRTAWRGLSLP